jgi:two-component system, cell cycle response regulator
MKLASTNFLTKKPLAIKDVVIRIVCIELLMEFLIMLLFSVVPYEFSTVTGAIMDAVLLVALTTPAIYFFVIKPFVEARNEAIVHINHLAHTDSLTKLANRRLVVEYLELMVAANARHKDHGAVLYIDLDGFKPINDNYGHDAGDALLVNIAERLKNCVRGEDIVGRLGGDEYIVLLRRLGADEKVARYVAQFVAYKLIKQVMEPVDFNGNILLVGASVGIRLFGAESDVHKIMSDADAAMYRAKDSGKGCAVFYDE